MGNCGSKRTQEKPPTIKSPKGDNQFNSNNKNFKPVTKDWKKKDQDSSNKPFRTTPTIFEKGKEKLLF